MLCERQLKISLVMTTPSFLMFWLANSSRPATPDSPVESAVITAAWAKRRSWVSSRRSGRVVTVTIGSNLEYVRRALDLRLNTKYWPPPVKTYDGQFYKIQKTNWNAIQLVMYPYLRLISLWCLQCLQLNCCVLTRRKSGPMETALSGHASAVLRVIFTNETLCVAWLLFLSALAASRRWAKTHDRNSYKLLPNFHADVPVLCP